MAVRRNSFMHAAYTLSCKTEESQIDPLGMGKGQSAIIRITNISTDASVFLRIPFSLEKRLLSVDRGTQK